MFSIYIYGFACMSKVGNLSILTRRCIRSVFGVAFFRHSVSLNGVITCNSQKLSAFTRGTLLHCFAAIKRHQRVVLDYRHISATGSSLYQAYTSLWACYPVMINHITSSVDKCDISAAKLYGKINFSFFETMCFGHLAIVLRLRNDLYCVGWGVKLYSLAIVPVCHSYHIVSLWGYRLHRLCIYLTTWRYTNLSSSSYWPIVVDSCAQIADLNKTDLGDDLTVCDSDIH